MSIFCIFKIIQFIIVLELYFFYKSIMIQVPSNYTKLSLHASIVDMGSLLKIATRNTKTARSLGLVNILVVSKMIVWTAANVI